MSSQGEDILDLDSLNVAQDGNQQYTRWKWLGVFL